MIFWEIMSRMLRTESSGMSSISYLRSFRSVSVCFLAQESFSIMSQSEFASSVSMLNALFLLEEAEAGCCCR